MIWSLAFSSLVRRPLRTVLTALGIAVAVGSMVVFLSLGEGLRQIFAQELGRGGPDIQVSYGEEGTNPFGALPELDIATVERIRAVADEYGIESVTPILLFVRSSFVPTSTVIFQGVPADLDPATYAPGFELSAGEWLDGGRSAVIGESAAQRLGLEVGRVLAFNPDHSFTITGIAGSDGGFVDNSVLVDLAQLQEAMGVSDRVSYLTLSLDVPGRASEVAGALEGEFPELTFQTSSELLEFIERGLRIGDAVRLAISGIALLVGAIAVANTLLMSVFERTREFAVLRAVGARPRFLLALVLAESILLSLAGAAAGLGIGRLGVSGINVVADRLVGLEVAAVTVRLAVFAILVALAIGLVSGLLPAARAARVPIATAMARE